MVKGLDTFRRYFEGYTKENGETIDSNDIKKHKKDVLRIAAELMLENTKNLPTNPFVLETA